MRQTGRQGKILRQLFLLLCALALLGFSGWVIWFCCVNKAPRAIFLLAIPGVFVVLYGMVKKAL